MLHGREFKREYRPGLLLCVAAEYKQNQSYGCRIEQTFSVCKPSSGQVQAESCEHIVEAGVVKTSHVTELNQEDSSHPAIIVMKPLQQ